MSGQKKSFDDQLSKISAFIQDYGECNRRKTPYGVIVNPAVYSFLRTSKLLIEPKRPTDPQNRDRLRNRDGLDIYVIRESEVPEKKLSKLARRAGGMKIPITFCSKRFRVLSSYDLGVGASSLGQL